LATISCKTIGSFPVLTVHIVLRPADHGKQTLTR